jgi:hypothetical protein
VAGVARKHTVEMTATENQGPVQGLVAQRLHAALGNGIGLGDLMGVRMIRMPSLPSTSSHGPQNLASRSWSEKSIAAS